MNIFSPDWLKSIMPDPGKKMQEWRDPIEKGLIFRVTASGDRRWSLRYVNSAGDHRRASIGPFPAVGLAASRARAREIKGSVASKVDVVGVEKQTKAEARRKKLQTVAGLAEAYFVAAALGTHVSGNARPKRVSTIKEDQRVYEKLVRPRFGNTPVVDMRRAEIQAFVDSVSKKARGTGRQCRDVIRQLLSYAVRQGLVEFNPAIGVGAVQAQPRDRVLTDSEVQALWAAFAPPRMTAEMGLALRMAMTTLQRGNEVVGMRWAEIDLTARTWSIPAARMKGKRPHLVPLSDLAMSLLDEAKEKIGGTAFVFQSPAKDGPQPMERRALTRAMNRTITALKLPRATPHDFRRTGGSNITGERIGMSRFIVGQVLAHADGGVTGRHYDKNDYLPEKRRALEAWAALLDEIVSGKERPSNVVPLSA